MSCGTAFHTCPDPIKDYTLWLVVKEKDHLTDFAIIILMPIKPFHTLGQLDVKLAITVYLLANECDLGGRCA